MCSNCSRTNPKTNAIVCTDCEFVGKWVDDVEKKKRKGSLFGRMLSGFTPRKSAKTQRKTSSKMVVSRNESAHIVPKKIDFAQKVEVSHVVTPTLDRAVAAPTKTATAAATVTAAPAAHPSRAKVVASPSPALASPPPQAKPVVAKQAASDDVVDALRKEARLADAKRIAAEKLLSEEKTKVSDLQSKIALLERKLEEAEKAAAAAPIAAAPVAHAAAPVADATPTGIRTDGYVPVPPPLPDTDEADEFCGYDSVNTQVPVALASGPPQVVAAPTQPVAAAKPVAVAAPSKNAINTDPTNIPVPPPLPGQTAAPVAASATAASKPTKTRRGSAPAALSKFAKRRPSLREKTNAELRPVFWNVLATNNIEGTIWEKMDSSVDKEVESFFGVLETRFAKAAPKKATKKSSVLGTSSKAAPVKRPSFLDGNRAQNLGIGLARLAKKFTNQQLRDAVVGMDAKVLGDTEIVQKLMNLAPTPEEISLVGSLGNSKENDYSREEDFVIQMATVPRFIHRLQCVYVKSTFDKQADALAANVKAYQIACDTMANSKKWGKLLKIVLSCGNYVNDSSSVRGGAWGIELTSGLPKLSECKASDNAKFSLLHWIAQVVDTKMPELFTLEEDFKPLVKAASTKLADLTTELAQLNKGANLISREIKSAADNAKLPGSKAFEKALSPFATTSKKQVADLTSSLSTLTEQASQLVKSHGERPSTSAQKLFQVTLQFVKALGKAREENALIKMCTQHGAGKKAPALSSSLAPTAATLNHEIKKNRLSMKFKKKNVNQNELLAAMQRRGGVIS